MTSNRKNILLVVIVILFLFNFTGYGSNLEKTDIPYPSYTYDFWEEPVPAPQAYYPSQIITGEDLGVDSLSDPRDLNISQYTENIYIVDTGNNRIICLDSDWELTKIIDSFENEGQEDTFNNPRGIYVNSDGDMYIADRDNARIVILDEQGELKKIISSPEGETEGVIFEDFRFRPSKVGVDERGRIFVVADEVYEGVMEFDLEGEFVGFFGAPSVTVDPFEYFWRRFSPEERRERLALFLPTEFSNLDIDKKGFVYTTVSGGAVQASHFVRRLNTAGRDILIREGFTAPQGDYGSTLQDASGDYVIPGSVFVDITTRENDIYSVLDRRRGRIFTYDMNGNLLYVFGNLGNVAGTFNNATALSYFGDDLLVLDRNTQRLTLFEQTDYAYYINRAIEHSGNGRYENAEEMWQEVLRLNNNYETAFSSIAFIKYRQDKYQEAMSYFHKGNEREGYSKAFENHRTNLLRDKFQTILTVFIVLIAVLVILLKLNIFAKFSKILQKKRTIKKENTKFLNVVYILQNKFSSLLESIIYAFHLILHPFSGFWDLKHEKKGTILAGLFWLLMVIVVFVFNRQYTGFIFNERNPNDLNIILDTGSIIIPFILFGIVNWSLTTFMEGKGNIREILIYTSYALVPFALLMFPATIISHGLSLNETNFLYGVYVLALLWPGILFFSGTLVTHDYSVSSTVLNLIFTIIGMGIILFIGLLFFNVIDLVIVFINDIYRELVFRI
ncbi:MAG: hypothetical protein ACOCV3_04055 [Halanaerobiales bacterium]